MNKLINDLKAKSMHAEVEKPELPGNLKVALD